MHLELYYMVPSLFAAASFKRASHIFPLAHMKMLCPLLSLSNAQDNLDVQCLNSRPSHSMIVPWDSLMAIPFPLCNKPFHICTLGNNWCQSCMSTSQLSQNHIAMDRDLSLQSIWSSFTRFSVTTTKS